MTSSNVPAHLPMNTNSKHRIATMAHRTSHRQQYTYTGIPKFLAWKENWWAYSGRCPCGREEVRGHSRWPMQNQANHADRIPTPFRCNQRPREHKHPNRTCQNCRSEHVPKNCPAYEDTCHGCGAKVHWLKCYRKTNKQAHKFGPPRQGRRCLTSKPVSMRCFTAQQTKR